MKRYPRRYKPLTQKRLKELLAYNPRMGIFKWKNNGRSSRIDGIAGSKNGGGYVQICVDGKSYLASRLAYLYIKGYFPEYEVDHRDRVRDNNKWKNLRHVTHQCNMKNRSISKANKSGVTGVRWYDKINKWRSYISVNGKLKHLGYFNLKKEAVQVRCNAEVEYKYHYCLV